jgi:thiamine biosynthesis protein ThiS
MISIKMNGEPIEIKDNFRVLDLLNLVGLDPRQVAVERNREIVPRATYGETVLCPDDTLEIVTFVGGG